MQVEAQKEPFAKRALYGGAMELVLPTRFMDISTVREVPDHQEVFADVKTDQSVIVELVNMAGVADDEAAVFHFRELASDNDALNEAVVVNVERIGQDNLPNFAAGTVCHAVQGQQRVAKFNERTSAKNLVNIYFAVIRLPHKQTDILVTLNDPVLIAPGSSSSNQPTPLAADSLNSSAAVFQAILRTIKVNDMSLFDGHEEDHDDVMGVPPSNP